MSSSAIPTFSGTSTFSSDFTQVITRAQSIASLPISLLTNQKNTLTGEQSALSSLSATFSSLQASLLGIGTSAGSGNYSVSYSDSSVANAIPSSGALLGTYNLQVIDPGSKASAASTATVTDPTTQNISSSSSFTLTANGQTYANIMPPPNANTLTSLVSAINTATQGAVQATIVNVGTPSQPSYQLSIQNSSYGALPITLDDGSGNLLGTPTTATSIQYLVNGQPASPATPLSADTRTLSIAPNLSVSVLKAGTTDITVSQNTTNIANAISGFVTAYNNTAQALAGQRGQSGGALAGQSIVSTLSQSLHDITGYNGSGSIQSIADLGLTFDQNGTLSFDSSVLSSAAARDFQGVTTFLGNTSTGGFLKAANDLLNGITDSTSGSFAAALNSVTREITSTDNQISTDQDRVDLLTKNLTAQMSAADALIAQMQQQVTSMTNLFAAMTANQNALK